MSKDFEDIWEKIKTERDELRVQAHLATAEVKDELKELEKTWREVEDKMRDIKADAVEVSAEVRTSTKVVLEELGSAYRRIKSRLDDS